MSEVNINTEGFRYRPRWLFGVAGLLLAQAGFVLGLFDQARTFSALGDEQPILSGRHPLHQYHGALGASSFRYRGGTTCYDPSFQAGYPKTPVFDGGCRPAELFAAIAGGYSPAAYKRGLFLCVLLIPLAFVLAARGAGLSPGASVLAGAGGLLLCWSGPVRAIIEEGELDFLMAGLGAIVFVSWLTRFSKWCTADGCAVLALTTAAGWYAHPLVWLGLFPIVVGYYLVFAPRHGPAWHLGFLGISIAGLAPNLWWLTDWARYWWLRQPSASDHIPIPEWYAVLGSPGDYFVLFGCIPGGAVIVLAGLAGLVAMWRNGHRGATGLLLGTILLTTAVARLLVAWPRVPVSSAERMVPLVAGLLVLPAAFGAWQLMLRVKAANIATGCLVGCLVTVGWLDGPGRPIASFARLHVEPLLVGFSPEQEQTIATLRQHTGRDARILWDETTAHQPGWNWSALLPLLTELSFLGGLDYDSGVEHSYCGMKDGLLNGRSLADWTDADLAAFCRWYNVGWVVCRCDSTAERWRNVSWSKPVSHWQEDGVNVTLFVLNRPRSFILSGSATWEEAGPNRITLTNVAPDAEGKVDLSLHHVQGWRAYPSYIRLSHPADPAQDTAPDPTGRDPVNHVRLRMPGPVPRVTLVWEGQ